MRASDKNSQLFQFWVRNDIFYCNDDDDRPNTAKFYMRPIGGTTVLYMGHRAIKKNTIKMSW